MKGMGRRERESKTFPITRSATDQYVWHFTWYPICCPEVMLMLLIVFCLPVTADSVNSEPHNFSWSNFATCSISSVIAIAFSAASWFWLQRPLPHFSLMEFKKLEFEKWNQSKIDAKLMIVHTHEIHYNWNNIIPEFSWKVCVFEVLHTLM